MTFSESGRGPRARARLVRAVRLVAGSVRQGFPRGLPEVPAIWMGLLTWVGSPKWMWMWTISDLTAWNLRVYLNKKLKSKTYSTWEAKQIYTLTLTPGSSLSFCSKI